MFSFFEIFDPLPLVITFTKKAYLVKSFLATPPFPLIDDVFYECPQITSTYDPKGAQNSPKWTPYDSFRIPNLPFLL